MAEPKNLNVKPTIEITLIACVILLLGIGFGFLYSASQPSGIKYFNNPYYYLGKQSIYLIFGIVSFFIGLFLNHEIYRKFIKIIVLSAIILLILTLIPGIGKVVGGARRWISFFNIIQFQPSEIAKLVLIFYLASVLSNKDEYIKDFYKGVLPPLIFVSFISFLILAENDFSTAFLFLFVSIILIYLAGARILTLILLSIIGLFTGTLLILLAPYRTVRLFAFINPWEDPLDSGWHYIQSMKCFAIGKLLGKGIGESVQKNSNLPEAHNDYIFAIIGEEGGVFLSIIIIALYTVLAIAGLNIARRSNNKYSFLIASGLIIFIYVQAMINIAVVLSLVPATGVTLPFVSSGGTSLVVFLFAVGILLNISIKNRKNKLEGQT